MSTQPLRSIITGTVAVLAAWTLAGCGDESGPTTVTVTITQPGIVGPNSTSPVSDARPTLTITNASVSDGSTPTYSFEISTDNSFATALRQVTGIAQGSAQTSWRPDSALADGTYFWRARASASGQNGPFSATARFVVSGGPGVGAGETQVLFDELTNGTTQAEQFGGSLTSLGWRINANSDFLRYEVPTVTNGYVQWQNLGLTPRGANDASHMLFGMWDPSAGAFRQNPFRVHVQKLWSNPHNPPFIRLRWISQGRLEDAGFNFTDWNPSQVYTWRLDWGPSSAGANRVRLFLDGVEIMQIGYNRTYSPSTHFLELGIGERGESVIDAIYRNFTVVRR